MMDHYSSATAFMSALKANARQNRPTEVNAAVRQAVYDRFLSRIFSSSTRDEWVLKGAVGMLARVPGARHTQDIDLMTLVGKEDVESILTDALDQDMGDHLRFEIVGMNKHADLEDLSPEGIKAVVRCWADAKMVSEFKVDIVGSHIPVGEITAAAPHNRLKFGKQVKVADYRLYPPEDHLAEKMSAMLLHHKGERNTRVRDLVDVLMITDEFVLDNDKLHQALRLMEHIRGIRFPREVQVPQQWSERWEQVAKRTPYESLAFGTAVSEASLRVEPYLQRLGGPQTKPGSS